MQKNSASNNGNLPLYLFHQGTNVKAYDFMGVHKAVVDGKECMVCRVWAPNAKAVSIAGDFNEWKPDENVLEKISDGVWECYLPFVIQQYQTYKFCVESADDRQTFKSDPYAYHFETRPGNASKYYDIEGYNWSDTSCIFLYYC